MSYFDFKAKMHQIRFRLGLHPRPCWGSSQRYPRPETYIELDLSFKGTRTSKGKDGREQGKGGVRKEGEG